jgi:hypothetical protein
VANATGEYCGGNGLTGGHLKGLTVNGDRYAFIRGFVKTPEHAITTVPVA